jgi:hypothetical protein
MEAGSEQCNEPDDEKLCELSVDGVKIVDSIIKLAGWVEEARDRMDPARRMECSWGTWGA